MAGMNELGFNVRAGNQSGARYFIKYAATIELLSDPANVDVEMVSVSPADAPQDRIAEAIESVRRGAQKALAECGKGARIKLHNFCLHPIDFSAMMCELATVSALRKTLARPAAG
jgi:hypothetical protein